MRLFIAEKPSVAKVIAESLGIVKRCDGYIECKNDNIVTNCFGHLLELAEPDFYLKKRNDPDCTGWRMEDLPIIPKPFVKEAKTSAKKQLKIIGDLLKKAETAVNAGDSDREGQSLVDEVLEHFKYKGKILRYWAQATDETSVQRALKNLVPNKTYANWGAAAEARAQTDWLIGMNISRAVRICNRSLDGSISVGRVQTPVLKLIIDREDQIKNFKAKEFFNLFVTFQTKDKASYQGKMQLPEDALDTDGYLTDKTKADAFEEIISTGIKEKAVAEVTSYKQQIKHESAPLPFALADLQILCYRLFGYSSNKVLEIAQKLYEEYKLTTYPRSSCQYLPTSQKADVPKILANLKMTFPDLANLIDKANPEKESKLWNDKKVNEEAHTGIVPTLHAITEQEFNTLPDDCKKVYDVVAKRYISQFLDNFTYYQTSIITHFTDYDFLTTGRTVINPGFKELLEKNQKEESEEEQNNLPKLSENDKVQAVKIDTKTSKTQPPKPFNEASIIDTMINIGKYLTDPEERKLLKETKGLGTDATRANIIETLKKRDYITSNKKGVFASTEKGRQLLKVIPLTLQSASLSAQTEDKLHEIQSGTGKLEDFINSQLKFLDSILGDVQKMADETTEKCPACGKPIYRNRSKFGKKEYYWHCSDCGKNYTDNDGKIGEEIIKKPLEKCPACGKAALHRLESKFKKGEFNFWCSECKKTYKDNDGKVGEEIAKKQFDKCPACGKAALHRLESKFKPGEFLFWCSECKKTYKDNDGKVGEEIVKVKREVAICPKCKKKACFRLPTKKDPNKYWWACKECHSRFADKDGKIGEEFGS